MTTNQTIDGVLVSRELLEVFAGPRNYTPEQMRKAMDELRALLDAPAVEVDSDARHLSVLALHDVMQAVPSSSLYSLAEAVVDAGYTKAAKLDAPACETPSGAACPGDGVGPCKKCPAAQPQGVPVAWVVFDNGFIDDHTVVKTVADEWADRGLEVTPLYAEQLAPVAVVLAEAREWLGDGKNSDGLAREHWTPEYAALIDRIDATLRK